jgi:hypothetical protein
MANKVVMGVSTILKKSFLPSLIFLISMISFSQESIKDATGSWTMISSENAINSRWSIPAEGILRSYNLYESTEFGLLRTGITFNYNPLNSLTVGIVHIDSQPFDHYDSESLATQFWLYEQYQHKTNFNKLDLTQRVRIEHRWLMNQNRSFNNRFRYRLQMVRSINPNTYLKIFDELFFDFSETQINQNRIYIGLGQKISKGVKMEVGYIKNHIAHNNYDRVNMALYLKTHLFKQASKNTSSSSKLSYPQ